MFDSLTRVADQMTTSGSEIAQSSEGAKPFCEFMELYAPIYAPRPGIFMNWQLRSCNDLSMGYLTALEKWFP